MDKEEEEVYPYMLILRDYEKHTEEELTEAHKIVKEYFDKQPKYEPEEFTFITKLKENKKWYYKEDD